MTFSFECVCNTTAVRHQLVTQRSSLIRVRQQHQLNYRLYQPQILGLILRSIISTSLAHVPVVNRSHAMCWCSAFNVGL
jgi:hypothetical protein